MFDLTGKIAYVTGGGSGIGRAIAHRLSAAGARMFVLDIDEASARRTADEVGGTAVAADVADADAMAAALDGIAAEAGRIDIAVNNAGIALELTRIEETTPEHFETHLRVNTLGILNGMRHAARHMPDGAAIVNTASVLGLLATPGYASYAASKFAVVGITKIAAVELGPRGIRVNAVAPTTVNTPMLDTFPAAQQEADAYAKASALGRIIEPEHVAALVHFLVADDCPVITGQAIAIDAGITAGISSAEWEAAAPR
jgi:3alpha(or 20beta)-hydroxysteroid dehydrogenase